MNTLTQLWQNNRSGKVVVVRTGPYGIVLAAAYVPSWRQIPAALAGNWESDEKLVADLNESPFL